MKTTTSICTAIIAGFLLSFQSACKKNEPESLHLGPEKSLNALIFNPGLTYGTMTDQDGNSYKTIVIGTQTWMAENLRTTKYRNGDPIPNVTGPRAWMDLSSGAYCNYNNNTAYPPIYGRLYNEYAARDSRNIAPAGWHLPTFQDWRVLITFLDPVAVFYPDGSSSSLIVGLKLKEAGSAHWPVGTTPATNASGFTAVPGGERVPWPWNNESWFVEPFAVWWSADSPPRALSYLLDDFSTVTDYDPHSGYTIRLIKGN